VRVTEDRLAAIREISSRVTGASYEDVARTPFALIGTYGEMTAQLRAQASQDRRFGAAKRAGAQPRQRR
jgi:hypothetical protein